MRPIFNHDLLWWQACRLQRVEQNAVPNAFAAAFTAANRIKIAAKRVQDDFLITSAYENTQVESQVQRQR
jgi:hypothetical protein